MLKVCRIRIVENHYPRPSYWLDCLHMRKAASGVHGVLLCYLFLKCVLCTGSLDALEMSVKNLEITYSSFEIVFVLMSSAI